MKTRSLKVKNDTFNRTEEVLVCLLEYVMSLLGLGWRYSPLVLGLIRDKGRLLKGQVSLAWELSKPLYIRRGDVLI